MKKTTRFIAMLLALVLAFGDMLNVQAAPPVQEKALSGVLPEIIRAATADCARKGSGNSISLTDNFYIYPYGDTNDATVVKGKSIKLEFHCEISLPEYMFYVAEIYRGGIESLLAQIKRGGEPEPIETFVKPSSECSDVYLSFNWTADSRYPVGDYTMICFLYNAREEEIVTARDSFLSELHVVSEPKPASGITLWALTEDGWYEVPENGVVPSGIYLPQLSPIPTTDKPNFRLSTNSDMLIVTRGMDMWEGYIHLGAASEIARIAVINGNKAFFFWLKSANYDETTELTIRQEKTSLCVGQQDKLSVKRRSNPDSSGIHPYWQSLDPSIATVDAKTGVVTALRPGTARIKATAAYFTQTVEYTVSNHVFPEGTPVLKRTATQPAQSTGDCIVCGKKDCVAVYEEPIFTDTTPTAWYAPNVDYVYENAIMNGTTANKFAPNQSMTRAMVAAVLYRTAGSPEVEGEMPFSDIREGAYYEKAVLWAVQNGIVNGYADGTFLPNRNITREQLAAILYRYTNTLDVEMNEGAALTAFPDEGDTANYAREALRWAVGEGLVTGVKTNGATYLRPKNNATRAQFATIIARFMAMTAEKAPEDAQEQQPVR